MREILSEKGHLKMTDTATNISCKGTIYGGKESFICSLLSSGRLFCSVVNLHTLLSTWNNFSHNRLKKCEKFDLFVNEIL